MEGSAKHGTMQSATNGGATFRLANGVAVHGSLSGTQEILSIDPPPTLH